MNIAHTLRNGWLSLAGLAATLCLGASAHADTRVLLTLDWPPYTSLSEPGGGDITLRVNQAFKAIGDTTRIGYFTWHRVLQLPRTDRRFAGTFPMYYSAEREERCYFSDPIGESPVGLAENKASPIHWQATEDLKNYRIGVVRGYVNTPDFDRLMAKGTIKAVPAETDKDNLKNLLSGKVQAAVIDPNVLHYMNTHEIDLKGMETTLQVNPHLLVVHALYFCFPRDPAGKALRNSFNKGLHSLPGNTTFTDERPKASRQ